MGRGEKQGRGKAEANAGIEKRRLDERLDDGKGYAEDGDDGEETSGGGEHPTDGDEQPSADGPKGGGRALAWRGAPLTSSLAKAAATALFLFLSSSSSSSMFVV